LSFVGPQKRNHRKILRTYKLKNQKPSWDGAKSKGWTHEITLLDEMYAYIEVNIARGMFQLSKSEKWDTFGHMAFLVNFGACMSAARHNSFLCSWLRMILIPDKLGKKRITLLYAEKSSKNGIKTFQYP
jgi:hypothetical protein